jgi:hypothetical protein
MYDWPPSAPDANHDHDITYLIIDSHREYGPPYRVSCVDGDRLMYEIASALAQLLSFLTTQVWPLLEDRSPITKAEREQAVGDPTSM